MLNEWDESFRFFATIRYLGLRFFVVKNESHCFIRLMLLRLSKKKRPKSVIIYYLGGLTLLII